MPGSLCPVRRGWPKRQTRGAVDTKGSIRDAYHRLAHAIRRRGARSGTACLRFRSGDGRPGRRGPPIGGDRHSWRRRAVGASDP